MPLVDLRGREREPEVLSLLEPEPGWILVGWSRDERLVACAAVERVDPDEVAVRALAAMAEEDARSLLGALVGAATGARIVAPLDAKTAAAFHDSGFAAEADAAGGKRLVRMLAEQPAPAEAVATTSLPELELAIRSAWSRETSDDPDEWSEQNRARGQCAVTALLVRELLGGDILVANVLRDGRRVERHAWNRLPSGLTLDLTREQFVDGEQLGEPRVEEPMLTHRNPERFELLRARVRAQLALDA
jgi:hypothetical protein